MTTPTVTETRPRAAIGERVELARYTVSAGARVIYGQRIDRVVRLTDRPANGPGRAYLIERELEQQEDAGAYAALLALVTDYVDQAGQLKAIPMACSALRAHLLH